MPGCGGEDGGDVCGSVSRRLQVARWKRTLVEPLTLIMRVWGELGGWVGAILSFSLLGFLYYFMDSFDSVV